MRFIGDGGQIKTGLVSYIQSNFECPVVTDDRTFPNATFNSPNLKVALRDYQIDYVLAALKKTRMIIHATTGAGKTIMMAAIMDIIGLNTLIMVPNKTLQGQLRSELDKFLPTNPDYKITIGIPQNLNNLTENELQSYAVVLADECHNYAAAQAMNVILIQNAPFRFGFTGTPYGRSDGRDLEVEGLFGEVVQLVETSELVEQGFIAPTQVDFYHASWDGDYPEMERVFIVENVKRNALIAQLVANSPKKSFLILVRRVEHGRILQKLLPNSAFVHGDSSIEFREGIRDDVKTGKIRILIASNVFAAGLDIPNLAIGINAGGGKAEILTGQKAGRMMRPWENTCKKWIDIYDAFHPTMEQHSKERYKIYKNAGLPIDLIDFPSNKQDRLEE